MKYDEINMPPYLNAAYEGDDLFTGDQLRAAVLAEREAWRNAAIRIGENLATCGPAGYYDFTSQQWLDWALNVTTKMQDDYMQLGACGEREAIAHMIEDAPELVPDGRNDQGDCVVCGFDPKFAASYIRARGETK